MFAPSLVEELRETKSVMWGRSRAPEDNASAREVLVMLASGSLGIGSGHVSKGNRDETNKLEGIFAMSFQL